MKATYQPSLFENRAFIKFMMMYWEAPADMDDYEFFEENKYDLYDFVSNAGGTPEEIMEYRIRKGK